MSPPDRYLVHTHAVVTGGGRGIGAAIAAELARLGANLTLMGRDPQMLDAHAVRLTGELGVRVSAVPCDVADEVSVANAFAAARDAFGRRRGAHFAALDAQRNEARAAKQELIAEAETLSPRPTGGRRAPRCGR